MTDRGAVERSASAPRDLGRSRHSTGRHCLSACLENRCSERTCLAKSAHFRRRRLDLSGIHFAFSADETRMMDRRRAPGHWMLTAGFVSAVIAVLLAVGTVLAQS